MNNKIIGFTISKKAIDHNDVDVFKSKLNKLFFETSGLYVYLWGIGDIKKCFINTNCITLSFPIHSSLEDRNVLINIKNNLIEIENDWLGSIPIFYNKNRNIVSTLINKTLPNSIKNIDNEGLYNYLEFGFCVFEHTPFIETKFLRHFSKITMNKSKISIKYKKDYFLNIQKSFSIPNKVINLIDNYINTNASKTSGKIIIPTSGGYDSRLLNFLFKDKEKIKSFTYGITNLDKLPSCEVAKAEKLSEILHTKWKEIKLGCFHKYYEDWFKLFGCSTHLHGMYQIEFYKEILQYLGANKKMTVLSGIIGDGWSGKLEIGHINNFHDLVSLGYTHNLSGKGYFSKFPTNHSYTKKYYIKNKNFINKQNISPILTLRLKIILLSYLISIPDYLGIPTWAPFLNFDIVKSLLSIEPSKRFGRVWESEFFKSKGINLETMNISCTNTNTLNKEGQDKLPLAGINIISLMKLIKVNYLLSIPIKKFSVNYLLPVINKISHLLIYFPPIGKYADKTKEELIKMTNWYTHLLVFKSLDMTINKIKNEK